MSKILFLFENDKYNLIIITLISLSISIPIFFFQSVGYDTGFHMSKSKHLFENLPYVGWTFKSSFGTVSNLYPPLSYYFVSIFQYIFKIEIAYTIARIIIFCITPIAIYYLLRSWSISHKSALIGALTLLGGWMYFGDLYVSGYFTQDFSIMMILAFILLYSKSIMSDHFFSFWPIASAVIFALAVLSHYYVIFVIPIIVSLYILINPFGNQKKQSIIRTLQILVLGTGLSGFFILNLINNILNHTLKNIYCCTFDRTSFFLPNFNFYETRYFFGLPFFELVFFSLIVFIIYRRKSQNKLIQVVGLLFVSFFILALLPFQVELIPSPDREIAPLAIFAALFCGLLSNFIYENIGSKKGQLALVFSVIAITIVSASIGTVYMIIHSPFLSYPIEDKKTVDYLNEKMYAGEVIIMVSPFDAMWFNVYSDHFQSGILEKESVVNNNLSQEIIQLSSNPSKMKNFMQEIGSRYIIIPNDLVSKYEDAGFTRGFSTEISSIMQLNLQPKFVYGKDTTIFNYNIQKDKMTINLKNYKESNVTINQSFDPDWQSTIDGKQSKLYDNQFGFMTLKLDSVGKHTINLEFKPKSVFIGSLVSLMSVLIIGCGILIHKTKANHIDYTND